MADKAAGSAKRDPFILRKVSMTVAMIYPHIEKIEGDPARLKRIPRIRVSQIVIDYLNHGSSRSARMCSASTNQTAHEEGHP